MFGTAACIHILLPPNLPTRLTCTNPLEMLLHQLTALLQVISFHSLPVIHFSLSEAVAVTQIAAIIHHAKLKGQILQAGTGQQLTSSTC